MLLQGCLLQSSMVPLQLQANISMLLACHHQLPAQCCLSLHASVMFFSQVQFDVELQHSSLRSYLSQLSIPQGQEQ